MAVGCLDFNGTTTALQRHFHGTSTALPHHFHSTSWHTEFKQYRCFYLQLLRESVSPASRILNLQLKNKNLNYLPFFHHFHFSKESLMPSALQELFKNYVSQKKGGDRDTPPPSVSHCQHFPNNPSPLFPPLSAFRQPPSPLFQYCQHLPKPPLLLTRNFCQYVKGHCVNEKSNLEKEITIFNQNY